MYVDFKKTYVDLNEKSIDLIIFFVEGLQHFLVDNTNEIFFSVCITKYIIGYYRP